MRLFCLLPQRLYGDMYEALRAVATFYFRADKQGICDTLERYGVAEMLYDIACVESRLLAAVHHDPAAAAEAAAAGRCIKSISAPAQQAQQESRSLTRTPTLAARQSLWLGLASLSVLPKFHWI